jgi:hypothetical protein
MTPSIAEVHESLHGTKRTCHDFRVGAAFGSKAEVGVSSPPRAASGAKQPFAVNSATHGLLVAGPVFSS